MVTWYFYAPEFEDHQHLAQVLNDLGATKSVNTLQKVVEMGRQPDRVMERFGLVGDTSEQVDDAWEEVTEELSQHLDVNLCFMVYDGLMRSHDVDEFALKVP